MRKHFLVLLLVILATAAVTNAGMVKVNIEAEVDYIIENQDYYTRIFERFEDDISAGDIITGYYLYDSDMFSASGVYEFTNAPCGIFLSCNGYRFESDLNDPLFVMYFYDSTYMIKSYENMDLHNGTNVARIFWQLDGGASSASLPTTAPDLDAWTTVGPLVISSFGLFKISATVTSAYVVPEPLAVSFLGFGFLLLKRRK